MCHRMKGTTRALASTLTLCAVLLGSVLSSSSTPAQFLDPEFPITDAAVLTSAVSGDTLYVGGAFSLIGRRTGHAAVLDQMTAAPFGLLADGPVVVAIPDGAGGWYVGGSFTSIRGIPRSNIAQILPDMTMSDWDPSADNVVSALAVNGSTVYAGGSFQLIGGQARSCIAALSAVTGAADPLWNPSANEPVTALAVSGSTVYAGGHFTTIGGSTPRRCRLASTCIA